MARGLLFGRQAVVTLGSLAVSNPASLDPSFRLRDFRAEGFRISFKIVKTASGKPDTLELSIYNLSTEHRRELTNSGMTVEVAAGYPDNIAVIFRGKADAVLSGRDTSSVDWVTTVKAGDGERELRQGRINLSLRPGTRIIDAITQAAQQLGLDAKDALDKARASGLSYTDSIQQVLSGGVLQGSAQKVMNQLLKSTGASWSVQDEHIVIVPKNSTSDEPTVLLAADTGLIGSPELTKPDPKEAAAGDGGEGGEEGGTAGASQLNVIKVRSLLQPQIKPYGKVKIDAENLEGLFRAEKVTHEGDTHGQPWYTDIELTAL